MTDILRLAGPRRSLGDLEKSFAERRAVLKYGMPAVGRLDIDRLSAAFIALTDRNPVLYARIGQAGDRYYLEPREPYAVPFEVSDGDPDEFLSAPVDPLDQSKHVARLQVVRRGDVATVAFTFNHAIADGNAAAALMGKAWANYTTLVEVGELSAATPRPIPVGPHQLLDPHDAPPLQPPPTEFQSPATHLTGVTSLPRLTTVQLDTDRTTGIIEAVRARGITMHAAVAGAVLAAERSLIDRAGPVPMLVLSTVDFRALLPVPIDVLDITNGIGSVVTGQLVGPDDPPLRLGETVVSDIRARVADGWAVYSSIGFFPTPQLQAAAPPISYIGNVGRIPELKVPAELAIIDVRLGSPSFPTNAAMYLVYGYGGRLTISVLQPADGITEARQQQLTDRIIDGFTNLTWSHDGAPPSTPLLSAEEGQSVGEVYRPVLLLWQIFGRRDRLDTVLDIAAHAEDVAALVYRSIGIESGIGMGMRRSGPSEWPVRQGFWTSVVVVH
ncbi:hypothetical protein NBRGN_108_00080 [Nocardia brasiliensis NBRC 14402]|uniref:phthiocerol/phthiodiolone dimycocerosyl transferase family protein n=1 Tax=Nocardia brasiliensis TaxID=37326 RepID=UPI00045C4C77|nr:hypothetical protein [Nocardia brasiliensis]ASF07019.1 hypothetical protein CEQ30_06340 [Nocardia brasiliensis]GAJ86295.1 hypothetical protein NBRGN_108_00080 [Nocardia brasiliensis NBRC 14402]SUB47737.1 Phthiocerol/phthiodiolone dimycocerosyl transferase [Nocardia brasiliensis]